MGDHNHGDGDNSGGHMMMSNYFFFSEHATILFKEWHTMTWAEMLGSCIAMVVLSALYEGLKVGRELLNDYMESHSATASKVDIEVVCECAHRDDRSRTTNDSKTSSSVIMVDGKNSSRKSWRQHPIFRCGHFIQTFLHFVQLWMSLCLMLVFMTFNVYLCLAITVGGAIGYYCFAWAYKRRPNPDVVMCH